MSFIEGGRPSIDKYNLVINTLKTERLGLHELIRKVNLKQTQVNVIKSDLIDQGIINEVIDGKSKKYELRFDAPILNTNAFEELRNYKLKELEKIVEYANTSGCRMQFLCEYLGDLLSQSCKLCDNDINKVTLVKVKPELNIKLGEYKGNYFPLLDVEKSRSNLINGVASSYYGLSDVGKILHRCKYEGGGDFPDYLVKLTIKAYKKHFVNEKFDLILYVPPTESGDLVKNFAIKIAKLLKIPISHSLRKICVTNPQKMFQTAILKTRNVKNAFAYNPEDEIKGKNILLIDDIYDSGATIKEIGRYLSKLGANKVAPLVIAKTVGGDIVE